MSEHYDQTDPATMAGGGDYETISVRGIGFAPSKKQDLLAVAENVDKPTKDFDFASKIIDLATDESYNRNNKSGLAEN